MGRSLQARGHRRGPPPQLGLAPPLHQGRGAGPQGLFIFNPLISVGTSGGRSMCGMCCGAGVGRAGWGNWLRRGGGAGQVCRPAPSVVRDALLRTPGRGAGLACKAEAGGNEGERQRGRRGKGRSSGPNPLPGLCFLGAVPPSCFQAPQQGPASQPRTSSPRRGSHRKPPGAANEATSAAAGRHRGWRAPRGAPGPSALPAQGQL